MKENVKDVKGAWFLYSYNVPCKCWVCKMSYSEDVILELYEKTKGRWGVEDLELTNKYNGRRSRNLFFCFRDDAGRIQTELVKK